MKHTMNAQSPDPRPDTSHLIEGVFDLFCTASSDGFFVACSGEWEDLLGFTPDELRGASYFDLVHPRDLRATRRATEKLASGQRVTRFVNRYRDKAGAYRWFEWHAATDPGSGLIHAAIRDVTRERRLLTHAAHVEQISGIGSWELDPETHSLSWSSNTYAIFGLDPKTFRLDLDTALELFDPDSTPALREALRRLIQNGVAFDMTLDFVTASGEKRHGRATGGAEIDEGRITAAYGTFQDITALYSAQEEARRAREQLQNAIEALPDGFVLFDADDRIVAFNEQHRQLYPAMAELVRPGASFEELVRESAQRGTFTEAVGREEEWVAERLAAHRCKNSIVEQPLSDGRWLRIIENETRDGGRVGMRVDITTLKEQELRLTEILAGTNVGTWEWDMVSNSMSYNERWAEIIGYNLAEILPTTIDFWRRTSHPQDHLRAKALLEAHFRGETEFYEAEVRLRHKAGHWVWVLDRGRVSARDAQGKPLRMSGTHLDITERKQAEIALSESRERLQATLDAIPDLLFEIDEEGRFLSGHAGPDTPLAAPLEQFIGKTLEEVLPGDVAATGRQALRETLETGRSAGHQYTLEVAGQKRRFEISASRKPAGDGRARSCILMTRDITDRWQAQREREYQEELLRGLFQLSPVGIALNDFDTGAFIDINEALLASTGYTRDEFLQQSYWDVIPREYEPAEQEQLEIMLRTGRYGPFEKEYIHKSGRRYPVLLNGMLVEGRDGQRLIWSIIEDISARKQLEAALVSERDFLAQITATSVSAITALDENGAIVFANDEAERVLGIAKSSVEGRLFNDPDWRITGLDGGAFPIEDLPFTRVLETGEPVFDVRHAIEWPDGRRRILSINAAPIQQTHATRAKVVCSVTDITERVASEARIMSQAQEDALTGLANRSTLMEQLRRMAEDRRRPEKVNAFVLLDLDYFKEINDTFGHVAGDDLLKVIALRLRNSVRDTDLVARLGGDEFAILLRDLRRDEDIAAVIETLLEQIRVPTEINGREIRPSMSIGVAVQHPVTTTAEELYRNGDSALYHSKASGRNTWSLFDTHLRERIAQRKAIAHALEEAVAGRRLEIAYQPQIRLDTGEHCGFEILPFTRDANVTFLCREYLAIAEENGQIIQIGDRVLETALMDIAHFIDTGTDPGQTALNVSATQLKDEGFVARVDAMLRRYGLSAARLDFEISENIIIDRAADTIRKTLEELVRLGATISLDDFGTGAASLSHITRFPISRLKIDSSFVAAIGTPDEAARIPGTIIDLAHNLELGVIAEGVTHQEQFDTLTRAGCDFAQGPLISSPLLDREAIANYLETREILRTNEKVFLL
jgi:diguanylate cyclase (GGDEF)-like protein/PAS domain S-box-containing protein